VIYFFYIINFSFVLAFIFSEVLIFLSEDQMNSSSGKEIQKEKEGILIFFR